MSEDLAHDAHLRAALRHAPDHALSPPSGLTQSILAAARQAHQPIPASPAPPPMRPRVAGRPSLRAWLHRALSPRWAGAWAAALVVSLGLGLWLDLEPEPVVEPPAVVAANDTAAPSPAEAVAKPADATTAPPAASPDVLAKTQSSATTAAQAKDAKTEAPRQRQARAARAGGEAGAVSRHQEAAKPAQSRVAAERTEAAPALDPGASAAGMVSGASAEPSAERVAATTPSPAPAAPAPAPDAAQATAAAPAKAADERVADLRIEPSGNRLVQSLRAASGPVSPPLALLRRAQAESMAGSARWTWSAPGRPTIVPFDDAAQAWLSRAAQAAQGRWGDDAQRGSEAGNGGGDVAEARWWRDGWPAGTLRIEPGGLRWAEPGGRSHYAPLDAATLQRLRSD